MQRDRRCAPLPRHLLILVFALTFGIGVAGAEEIELTAHAGATLPLLSGADWFDTLEGVDGNNRFVLRFTGAVAATYRFSSSLALKVAGVYTVAGGGYSYTTQIASYNYNYAGTVRLVTLDLPLLLRGSLPAGGGFFYGSLGPGVTVLPGTISYAEESGDLEYSVERNPDRRLLLSGTVEAGYIFDFEPWLLDLGLRYYRSFTGFYTGESEAKTFLNGITLLVGTGVKL